MAVITHNNPELNQDKSSLLLLFCVRSHATRFPNLLSIVPIVFLLTSKNTMDYQKQCDY